MSLEESKQKLFSLAMDELSILEQSLADNATTNRNLAEQNSELRNNILKLEKQADSVLHYDYVNSQMYKDTGKELMLAGYQVKKLDDQTMMDGQACMQNTKLDCAEAKPLIKLVCCIISCDAKPESGEDYYYEKKVK